MLMTPKPRRVCVRDKDEDMHRGGGETEENSQQLHTTGCQGVSSETYAPA